MRSSAICSFERVDKPDLPSQSTADIALHRAVGRLAKTADLAVWRDCHHGVVSRSDYRGRDPKSFRACDRSGPPSLDNLVLLPQIG